MPSSDVIQKCYINSPIYSLIFFEKDDINLIESDSSKMKPKKGVIDERL
jgi:hypothetical protein